MNVQEKLTSRWSLVFQALILLNAVGFGGSRAEAATRTVQFAGLMGAETETTVGPNASYGFCQVLVTNLGASKQKIKQLTFLGYDLSGKKTLYATADGKTNADQMVLRGVATTSGTDCMNKDLSQGDLCLFRYATQPVPMEGRYTPCAGTMVVEDSTPAQPGSLIAAGSITQFQEAIAVGGMFSGGFYLSGTHVLAGSANLAQFQGFGGTPTIPYNTTGMNFYCAAACLADSSPLTAAQCAEHCGGGSNQLKDQNGREWSNITNSFGNLVPSAAWAPSPVPIASPNPYVYPSPPPGGRPIGVLQAANAHYAGGFVVEMTMGPLNQICSGNSAFWEQGGDEFSHADGVDNHAIYLGNSTFPQAPPERLLCSHRHGKDDLFMRVGSSTSFTINGGSPF